MTILCLCHADIWVEAGGFQAMMPGYGDMYLGSSVAQRWVRETDSKGDFGSV
jgi:hypothetical protein